MNFLVTAATGTVGSHAVRALTGRGATVRALVRDPAAALGDDVEVVVGDLADRSSLDRALDGIDRLFLACANVPGQVDLECAAIDAAREAGVGLVVKLSGPRADVESPLVFERWHGEIERHLVASGVPSVLLRPAAFMTNLLAFAGTIADTGMLFAPAGSARIAFVDPRDVAAAAAVALVEDGHHGRAYRLTGPAAITYEEVAATLSAATGRAIRYVDVPDDAARQSMVEAGLPPFVADAIVAVFASQRAGAQSLVTAGIRNVTGWEPRNLAQFARDHAALFGDVEAGVVTAVQRWTLTVVCAATAMLMLDIAVVNTALSAIAADLDTGLSGLQWVVDAYTLPLAAVVITAGALADRFGRRRLFGIGLVVFTATSMLCAAAPSIVVLDVARAAQGVGAAMMFAVSLAVLSHAFPRQDERIKALAAYGATMAGSFAIGPLVGGALTSGLGWRWIFLINLPLGLLCLWIVRRFVVESKDPRAPRVDRPGLVTLTGGLFLLVLALLRGNEDGWGSARVAASFAGAVVLLVAFVAVEARSTHPMLPLRLFRNPTFTGAQVAAFGISGSLFALWFYMTLYLQQILGLSAIGAGLVYLPGTILNFVVAGATADVGQRVSSRTLVSVGLGLVGVGLALLTIVGVDTSWWLFLPGLLVALFGTGMFNPAVSQVALSSAPPEQSGLAAGVNDMFRQAGIAVGVAALGALIPASAAFGDGSPQSYVDGFHEALWVGAGLAAVCAVAAALLIRPVDRPGARSSDGHGDDTHEVHALDLLSR